MTTWGEYRARPIRCHRLAGSGGALWRRRHVETRAKAGRRWRSRARAGRHPDPTIASSRSSRRKSDPVEKRPWSRRPSGCEGRELAGLDGVGKRRRRMEDGRRRDGRCHRVTTSDPVEKRPWSRRPSGCEGRELMGLDGVGKRRWRMEDGRRRDGRCHYVATSCHLLHSAAGASPSRRLPGRARPDLSAQAA
uniref:Uncharacterized protein n=1 Tax=Arundo donax TaxID=35708 RepID=A0A0A9EFA5_ARUDO